MGLNMFKAILFAGSMACLYFYLSGLEGTQIGHQGAQVITGISLYASAAVYWLFQ